MVTVEKQLLHILMVVCVCVCVYIELSYPAGRAYAPCYNVICGQSKFYNVFPRYLKTARVSEKKMLLDIKRAF
jgi:hypothetical protein